MGDHPNANLIELLYNGDETEPAVAVRLESDGPRIGVSTGYTDDPVESQLSMLAGYMTWLAHNTEVDVERVAEDALDIAREMREADSVFVDPAAFEEE